MHQLVNINIYVKMHGATIKKNCVAIYDTTKIIVPTENSFTVFQLEFNQIAQRDANCEDGDVH